MALTKLFKELKIKIKPKSLITVKTSAATLITLFEPEDDQLMHTDRRVEQKVKSNSFDTNKCIISTCEAASKAFQPDTHSPGLSTLAKHINKLRIEHIIFVSHLDESELNDARTDRALQKTCWYTLYPWLTDTRDTNKNKLCNKFTLTFIKCDKHLLEAQKPSKKRSIIDIDVNNSMSAPPPKKSKTMEHNNNKIKPKINTNKQMVPSANISNVNMNGISSTNNGFTFGFDCGIGPENEGNNNSNNKNMQCNINNFQEFYHMQMCTFGETIIELNKNLYILNEFFDQLSWNFNAIEFVNCNELKNINYAIPLMVYNICKKENFVNIFNVNEVQFINWLLKISSFYNDNNIYHNKYHSVDVINSTYWLLKRQSINGLFKPIHIFIGVIAAAMHDVGHNGLNNDFHKQSNSDLYKKNNTSPLESMHITLGLGFIAQDKECDWFTGMDTKVVNDICLGLKTVILGTNNYFHNNHILFISGLIQKKKKSFVGWLSEDDEMDLLSAIVHLGDIANATKKWSICKEWAEMCIGEFRAQGVKEMKEFKKYSKDLMKSDFPLEKSQTGWIKGFMNVYVDTMVNLFGDLELLSFNLKNNLQQWGKYKEFN